jgi:ribosomal protein L7/L12
MIDEAEFAALKHRVAELEEQMKFIYSFNHLEFVKDGSEIENRAMNLIRNGDKIGAIKLYREATNCDLLTAKNKIDELAKRF